MEGRPPTGRAAARKSTQMMELISTRTKSGRTTFNLDDWGHWTDILSRINMQTEIPEVDMSLGLTPWGAAEARLMQSMPRGVHFQSHNHGTESNRARSRGSHQVMNGPVEQEQPKKRLG